MEKREIPKNIQDLKHNILINRYIKMHPKNCLKMSMIMLFILMVI